MDALFSSKGYWREMELQGNLAADRSTPGHGLVRYPDCYDCGRRCTQATVCLVEAHERRYVDGRAAEGGRIYFPMNNFLND